MLTETLNKEQKLENILKDMNKVVIAFSGGVDSSLVLKKAVDVLGHANVKAVIVKSELFRHEEFNQAIQLANQLNAPIIEAEIEELKDPHIIENTPDSWYYSKRLLYSKLEALRKKYNFNYVLDGMIMDDLDDFRPGLKARTEFNVRSILQEADLYKSEIREISKTNGLPVWNKPALCSLASRIPYGETLNFAKVNKVNEAEKYILSLDISNVRVRYHHNIARVEVNDTDIPTVVKYRKEITLRLKELGFDYVTIDLEGYRTGSMNEVINSLDAD
ncbi:ATP-dependent sacrificial sulfur transferase LarE [Staphylococcus pseudoxylosus]|uniref:ATP-dependent sacrificial sulfur transferase LarE n=1 Tax=Staphylococcus pseudoxylosus TaxID=2282419 RepID=UPI0029906E0C|nr:ATP-dependent sacrificial sulfur transferase LarE [Staphylococcus pseudoxylosus]MDW8797644.1 ATP-dependent sacrificial sulfur transferase LarE [Staphylococcus pseudoxylosus]MEB6037078.1 ATP-dependent sacrificial sulfur transferase LarE [Staphylococcus pseudoxylosus]MEB6044224.1 ATP-dependent sacrificial sulfur transferase LarE [Staphylococcus pseudoxylosus]MEB7764435.1 ATP-dependent sacrificial sulfur transferase LarE [Staphylococcus pseudoxylosus]MEB8009354.1 ATP-dependent sacrificial sulf